MSIIFSCVPKNFRAHRPLCNSTVQISQKTPKQHVTRHFEDIRILCKRYLKWNGYVQWFSPNPLLNPVELFPQPNDRASASGRCSPHTLGVLAPCGATLPHNFLVRHLSGNSTLSGLPVSASIEESASSSDKSWSHPWLTEAPTNSVDPSGVPGLEGCYVTAKNATY